MSKLAIYALLAYALYMGIAAYPSFCESVELMFKEAVIEMMVGAK